jgi:hypothetical protein
VRADSVLNSATAPIAAPRVRPGVIAMDPI